MIALILLLTHAFAGKNGNNNDVPLGSGSVSPALSPGQLGSGGVAPTRTDTDPSAGFSAEYSAQPFTLPGDGCTQDGHSDVSFTPSAVLFTQSGPQVSTDGDTNVDLALNCNDTGGTGATDIAPNNIEIAQVIGAPSASACYAAAQRGPIVGAVRYTDLHDGMEFCLVGGDGNNQLVLLTLVSTNASAFDLTWSATGWAVEGTNNT